MYSTRVSSSSYIASSSFDAVLREGCCRRGGCFLAHWGLVAAVSSSGSLFGPRGSVSATSSARTQQYPFPLCGGLLHGGVLQHELLDLLLPLVELLHEVCDVLLMV